MISPKKLAANRFNSRFSTGPKTAKGKASSSRNARRHGLSVPIADDPDLSVEVERLTSEIVGAHGSADCWHCARQVALAQVDLDRIWLARHEAINRAYVDENYCSPSLELSFDELLWIIENRNAAIVPTKIQRAVDFCPVGEAKLVQIFEDLAKVLLSLDRYERRALSRRKFAIRELDVLKAREQARA